MAKRSKSTALTKFDEELAKAAEAAAAQEASAGGGQFFSLRGGTLKFNDSPLPNNEMAVVIVDSVLENTYFKDDFDPDSPQGPDCYAFGRDEETMKPHKDVEDPEADGCAECDLNKFGSADRGRGKACRNRRRLALIPAGTLSKQGEFEAYEELAHFEKSPIAYLALPPTSINGYAAYVKQVAGALKRPPYAVFTRVALVDDEKSQFKVIFELLEPAPNELIPTLMQRHEESVETIEFPYLKVEETPATRRGKKAKKSKRPKRKY